jgi:hypothetical protein
MNRSIKIVLLLLGTITIAIGTYEVALQFAYSHIESLTNQYGPAMQSVITKDAENKKQEGKMIMETRLVYFKVFDVVSDSAKVYVVFSGTSTFNNGYAMSSKAGGFRYLRQQNGSWMIDSTKPDELIWDDGGALDGSTWPPYH